MTLNHSSGVAATSTLPNPIDTLSLDLLDLGAPLDIVDHSLSLQMLSSNHNAIPLHTH